LNRYRFSHALRKRLHDDYDVTIAFDPEAAAVALQYESNRGLCVVHLHEELDLTSYAGSRTTLRAIDKMLANIDRADLVITADAHRSNRLRETIRGSAQVLTVMNCPRLLAEIPKSKLLPLLNERGKRDCQVVHYQGAVGPDHGLEVVIKSISAWPPEAVLAIVGHGSDSYIAGLKQLAADCNVADRIVFVGKVPYRDVMAYAAGSTVGVTLLDTRHDNWRYAAGASNKRFEYAALGIPQVTNEGPGVDELFVATGIAMTADYASPEEVGARVSFYLNDRAARSEASSKARALHLSRYNYEHEYAPVLKKLGLT
jgi:glycosyltransferase involved in cell wall biosynthesis